MQGGGGGAWVRSVGNAQPQCSSPSAAAGGGGECCRNKPRRTRPTDAGVRVHSEAARRQTPQEVLTSFPSVGHHCFRVAVILSPYLRLLGGRVVDRSPPQPRCSPAPSASPPPPDSPLRAFCPWSSGLAAPPPAAVVVGVWVKWRRKPRSVTYPLTISVWPAAPLAPAAIFPACEGWADRSGPRAPGCRWPGLVEERVLGCAWEKLVVTDVCRCWRWRRSAWGMWGCRNRRLFYSLGARD